jgi:hypothetical protein
MTCSLPALLHHLDFGDVGSYQVPNLPPKKVSFSAESALQPPPTRPSAPRNLRAQSVTTSSNSDSDSDDEYDPGPLTLDKVGKIKWPAGGSSRVKKKHLHKAARWGTVANWSKRDTTEFIVRFPIFYIRRFTSDLHQEWVEGLAEKHLDLEVAWTAQDKTASKRVEKMVSVSKQQQSVF